DKALTSSTRLVTGWRCDPRPGWAWPGIVPCWRYRPLWVEGLARPDRGAAAGVDDRVPVVLHDQVIAAAGSVGAAGPHRYARACVDDEVPVGLHGQEVSGAGSVGAGGPQRYARAGVDDEVPVRLHGHLVLPAGGVQVLADVQLPARAQLVGVGAACRPHLRAGAVVDDEVPVGLHGQVVAAAGSVGAAGPHRYARAGVDDEVPVGLHGQVVAAAGSVGAAGPDHAAVPVDHQVPIALHVQDVLAARRDQGVPGGQHLPRLQRTGLAGDRRDGAIRGPGRAVGLHGGHRGRWLAAEHRRAGRGEVVRLAGEAFLDAGRRRGTGRRQGRLRLQRRAGAEVGLAPAGGTVHAPLGGVPERGKIGEVVAAADRNDLTGARIQRHAVASGRGAARQRDAGKLGGGQGGHRGGGADEVAGVGRRGAGSRGPVRRTGGVIVDQRVLHGYDAAGGALVGVHELLPRDAAKLVTAPVARGGADEGLAVELQREIIGGVRA